jgi:putative ABC transport system permease protein
MKPADLLRFSSQTLLRQRFRSAMILFAMGLGVAAVLVLTALGEGARGYVMSEFSSIGKDVLIMFPGRKETTGGMPPVMGAASREITLDEVYLLKRRLSAIDEIAPLIVGNVSVSQGERARAAIVLGTTSTFLSVRNLSLAQGSNLEAGDIRRATAEVIVGEKLKAALFDSRQAIGEYIRIGDSRFRVVGILAGRGDSMGMDLSDAAIIQVAAAQRLFNVSGLFRVQIKVREGHAVSGVRRQIEDVMRDFHQGTLDVTVVSPDAMLATFNDVLVALTLVVGAIGGISLLVAGILIMNVMMISVSQRTREIGLLKALGASSLDILKVFLAEALLLTGAGVVVGIVVGLGGVWGATLWRPDIPFATPLWAVITAAGTAMLSGLAFSWLPARRASQLQPVAALQKM